MTTAWKCRDNVGVMACLAGLIFLANEVRGVHLVGDVMVDALEFNKEIAEQRSPVLTRLGITPKQYLVLTVHRNGPAIRCIQLAEQFDERAFPCTIFTDKGNDLRFVQG